MYVTEIVFLLPTKGTKNPIQHVARNLARYECTIVNGLNWLNVKTIDFGHAVHWPAKGERKVKKVGKM